MATAMVVQRLALATGPRGGVYQQFGSGFARLSADGSAIQVVPRVTRGSAENLALLASGQVQGAIVNMGTAYEAWSGSGPWAGGAPMASLRAVMPAYPVPMQLVVLADSGIDSLRALAGRRIGVGVGPAKGPARLILDTLLADLGVAATISTDTPSLLSDQLLEHRIDAIWLAAELPAAAVTEVATRARVRLLSLDDDAIAAVQRRFPHMASYAIAASTYAGQTGPVRTAALWNFLVTRADLPDADVHALLATVLKRPSASARLLPAVWEADNPVASNPFLPWHPGAIAWFRESGVALGDR